MKQNEYDELQEALSKHLQTAQGYTGNKAEIFREGIRAAKSILHSSFKHSKED